MVFGEIQELKDTTPEELIKDDLMETVLNQCQMMMRTTKKQRQQTGVKDRQKGSDSSRLLLISTTWTLLGCGHWNETNGGRKTGTG